MSAAVVLIHRVPLVGSVVRSLSSFGSLLVSERHLIWEMTRRELVDQFKGQLLGRIWPIINPLVIVAIYIFIFGIVFSARGLTVDDKFPYGFSAYILSGLVPWLGLIRVMNTSTSCLAAHANLVKQVVFPIEVLPIKGVLAGFFGQIIGMIALILFLLIKYESLPVTYLLLPLLFLIQFLGLCGLGFILASLTPFFRDLKDLVRVYSQIGIFTLPIVFTYDMLPPLMRPILYINPFSYLIWCYQDALYFGQINHPWAWLVLSVMSVGILVVGWIVFRRVKCLFGNVL